MANLVAINYDPAVAVTKGTAASAMAAFDTANLRGTFVAPTSGVVTARVKAQVHGAITFSQIMLGVIENSPTPGLRFRQAPTGAPIGTALATTIMPMEVVGTIRGLTPGSTYIWDAAWGIETFVASSLIKYGGPDNTTANDAFGPIVFEVWEA